MYIAAMSERYGVCKCSGNCQACGGSGWTANAVDYMESQEREEWERERKNSLFSIRESAPHLEQMETQFYKNVMTAALQVSISVFKTIMKEK